MLDGLWLDAFGLAEAGDGAGEGVVGVVFEADGGLEDFEMFFGGGSDDVFDFEFAGGEGAGFVHGDHVGIGEVFDGDAAAEEDAVACASGDGGEDGGGDGEDESAG